MTVGKGFVGHVGQAGEHGSESWSLEVDWIDLGMKMNDSDNELPRDDISDSPGNHNVLLEVCDKENLTSYFECEPKRMVKDDIVRFWEGIFAVADGLFRIHETSPLESFQGSHQDVKPENILRGDSIKDVRDWSFKLADIGLSHFGDPSCTDNALSRRRTCGTSTYGAPERYRVMESTNTPGPKAIRTVHDLYSLGVIFSELAAWLVIDLDKPSEPATPKEDTRLHMNPSPRSELGLGRKRTLAEYGLVHPAEIRLARSSQGCNDFFRTSQSYTATPDMNKSSKWNLIKQMLEETVEGIDGWWTFWDERAANTASHKSSNCMPRHENKDKIKFCEGLHTRHMKNLARLKDKDESVDLGFRDGTYCTTRPGPLNAQTNLQNDSLREFQEAQAIIDWLHAASPANDFGDDLSTGGSWNHCISRSFQQRKKAPRNEGTGQWFLKDDQFVHWRTNREGIFWLSGSPGTGKSTLTSMALDALENNRVDGEYFVDFGVDPDFRGPSTVAAILWETLVQTRLGKPAEASQVGLHSVLEDLVHSGDRLSASRMKHIFSKIRHCFKPHETLYLFVDGLSDFEGQNERDLLYELFDHAGRSDPNHRVKLFISSSADFFGARSFKGSSRVDIDGHPKAKRDLALYVKTALQGRTWDQNSESFSKRVLDRTGGSFLKARLILQSAGLPSETESPLKVIGEQISRSVSTDLPTLYANVLGQLERRSRKVAIAAFSWLAYAARPLHSTEIIGALNMQAGTKLKDADILQVCGSLVVIDENQIVRFSHYSVRDFLESSINGRRSEISRANANEMIADTCLKTLYPQNLLRSLRLSAKKSSHLMSEIDCGHRESLVSYACRYWLFHYKQAEPGSSYIAGLLHKFLGKCIPSLDLVNTALRVGAQFGFPKFVRLELEMGANINLASGPEEYTPLIWAAKSGHLDTVKLLLEYGADPQIASSGGVTPLMFASANGHLEIVKLLLDHRDRNYFGYSSGQDSSIATRVAETVTQELSLETVFSAPCKTCGAVETGYQLSMAHNIICQDTEVEKLPPIIIKGEYISRAEMDLLRNSPALHRTNVPSNSPKKTGQKRSIKWFPGAKMHHSLEIAARRGIEDIRKLLVAVGNDISDLDRVLSVSKLVAKMRIS